MPAGKRVTILGSTGSVGRSTLDLIVRNRENFEVEALVAGSNAEALAQQAIETGARTAVVADPAQYATLRDSLTGTGIDPAAGNDAVVAAASRPRFVALLPRFTGGTGGAATRQLVARAVVSDS